MQTITRRAVTLPASKKRPFQTLDGDEKMSAESLESDRALTVAPRASAAVTDEEKVPPAHVAV